MSSEVRFAAIIPATCAVTSTSPLGRACSLSRPSVWAFISTAPRTIATRLVIFLLPTSTMLMEPSPAMWENAASRIPETASSAASFGQ